MKRKRWKWKKDYIDTTWVDLDENMDKNIWYYSVYGICMY